MEMVLPLVFTENSTLLLYSEKIAWIWFTVCVVINVNTLLITIGESAFSGCSNIETLYISNSIYSIGDNAFSNTFLTDINLSGVSQLKYIGPYAFYKILPNMDYAYHHYFFDTS